MAINYAAYQQIRNSAQDNVTRAKLQAKQKADAEAEAARRARSKKRSMGQKLLSGVARGAAAYYTGGLSEQVGGGQMIDDAILGKDSDGNSIQNEYGGLINAGTRVYQGMKANKASDVAKKRASNVSDYKEQVDLATKMGALDPKQGRDMMLEAQNLRSLQQGQTQKGEDAGLWGWDNKFDDLGMTPSQIKGQQVAQERQATTLASEGRRQGGQLDGRKAAEDQLRSRIRDTQTADRGPSGEQLDKGGREVRESDRLRSRISNIQTADRGPTAEDLDRGEGEKRRLMTSLSDQGPSSFNTTQSESKMAKIKMDDMMDKEYDKKLGSVSTNGSAATLSPSSEFESNYEGQKANMIAGKGYGYTPSIGKTFSEKEAEELSSRDTDKSRTGSMDDIAIDSEGNRLAEKYSGLGGGLAQKWDSVANPEQAQLYLEHQQRQKEALDRERARTGGPMAGEGRQRASSERPESRFKKRILKRQALDRISDAQLMDSLKNIGGINA